MRVNPASAPAVFLTEEGAWPSWKHTAVAPEKLGPYLREFSDLVTKRFGYKWTVFGHFGQGCIHTRITFDLKSRDGLAKFRRFMEEGSDLVVRYGGSLSGEHGDGAPVLFSKRLARS